MELINPFSLAETVDNISDTLFFGKKLTKAQRAEAARWIAGRQGLKGSYAKMFAPTELDFQQGAKLFTGERLSSRASTAHVLGEECLRVLKLLDVDDAMVVDAFHAARDSMTAVLQPVGQAHGRAGMFCCGTCSAALFRTLAAGAIEDNREQRLTEGVAAIKRSRTDNGKWRFFPFWYTVLALSEIGTPEAVEELAYCSIPAKAGASSGDKLTARKQLVLDKCKTLRK